MIGVMVPIAFAVTPTIVTSEIEHHPAAINLSDSSNSERHPVVVVKGDNIHVVWADETNSDVLYKKSSDGGATFAATIIVGDGSYLHFPHIQFLLMFMEILFILYGMVVVKQFMLEVQTAEQHLQLKQISVMEVVQESQLLEVPCM